MVRGISNTGHFGQAKQCLIKAFDTNYLMFGDEVMAIILHRVKNMDEELHDPALTAPHGPAPSILALVAVPTAGMATVTVAVAAVVDCPTSA
jgi:hypothetical protein